MVSTADKIEQYIDDIERPGRAALKAGPSVWFVISTFRLCEGDLQATAHEFDVPVEAIEAVAYYKRHKALIDARIEMNRA